MDRLFNDDSMLEVHNENDLRISIKKESWFLGKKEDQEPIDLSKHDLDTVSSWIVEGLKEMLRKDLIEETVEE